MNERKTVDLVRRNLESQLAQISCTSECNDNVNKSHTADPVAYLLAQVRCRMQSFVRKLLEHDFNFEVEDHDDVEDDL